MAEYVSVELAKADTTIRYLRKKGLLREDLKIIRTGSKVSIPVLSAPGGLSYSSNIVKDVRRTVRKSPYRTVMEAVSRQGVDSKSVPDKWIRYGDAIVLRLSGHPGEKKIVASEYAKALGISSVYSQEGGISGDLREPSLKLIYGKGGVVDHTENGIRFTFDPMKIMFSPGNINERVAMMGFPAEGKMIMDMFSGIGYFSLPIAKYQNPALVQCCELNPISIEFLKKNAEINRVSDKIMAFLGDSRRFVPDRQYDIIIMGNFLSTSFFVKALSLIGDSGLIVMHHLVSTDRLKSVKYDLMRRFFSFSYQSTIIDSHIVKSIGPNYYHLSTMIRVQSVL